MVMRYLGGFNAPSYNPLASNVTTGANTVQQGGIYTSSSASQNIPLGQWVDDEFYNRTSLLLQADNFANGSQNNTFLDSSTNNFTVTRNGNATQGSFSPFSVPAGYWSNSFDNTTQAYIATPSTNIFNFGVGDFSFEVFANNTSTSWPATWRFITTAQPFTVNGSTDGVVLIDLGSGGVSTGIVLPINTWFHFVVTRQGNRVRAFLNGVLRYTVINSTNFTATGITYVGGFPGFAQTWPGYLSNLRVINGGVPTAYQTSSTTLGTTVFSTPINPLTTTSQGASGTFSFLTCQNNRFLDNGSTAQPLTPSASVSTKGISPFNNNVPQFNGPPVTFPNAGGAAYFDGTGDYLDLTGSSNLAFGTGDWTIELWYYTNTTASDRIIYDSRPAGTQGAYPTIYQSGTSLFFLANSANLITSSGTIATGTWYHILVSKVSGQTRMFLNGTQQGSTYTDSINYLNGASRPRIGDGGVAAGSAVFGYISNLRVLKGAGVTSVTVPTAPLVPIANTQLLLSATNAGISDATRLNSFETVGNAQVSTAIKKYGSGSMFFDGTGDWLLIPDSPELRLGLGDFTVEAWIYVSSFAAARSIIGKGTGSTGWFFYVATTGRLAFGYGSLTLNGNNALVLNTWNHVAVVRFGSSSTNVRMYINGMFDAAASIATDFNQTNNMYVGADRSAANNFFGYIDDLRVTKNFARYTANFVPPTVALPRMG